MAVGEAILARLPELSVASAAKFSDLKKAERAALSDGWGDGVAVHAVLHEVLEGDWQLAVVETAVVGHLDLDAGENAMARPREHAICGGLQHSDGARRELLADAVAAKIAPWGGARAHITPRSFWRTGETSAPPLWQSSAKMG